MNLQLDWHYADWIGHRINDNAFAATTTNTLRSWAYRNYYSGYLHAVLIWSVVYCVWVSPYDLNVI